MRAALSTARTSTATRSVPGRMSAPRMYGPEPPSPRSCTCFTACSVSEPNPFQTKAPVPIRALTPVSARE
jgi:hypothetical protein